MNEALLVLGMHRSGTSAVTGALRLLGATPPRSMIPAAADNPSGFWESASVLGVNDWILQQGAAAWYECLTFESAALPEQQRARALTFIMLCLMAEFGGGSLPIIKDPRLCLLLDLWLPALQARATPPVAILVLRSPDAVAASLAARDGLPEAVVAALWLRYMLAAEHATRGYRRHIVVYDALLMDWRGALASVADHTGIVWPVSLEAAAPRMDSFLDTRLRHVGGVPARAAIRSMPFGVWLDEAYRALHALGQDSADQRQLARLDDVHMAFLSWCQAHGRAWSSLYLSGHAIRGVPAFEVSPDWHRIAGDLPGAMTSQVD